MPTLLMRRPGLVALTGFALVALTGFALLAGGCGPKIYPVIGTLQYADGQPAADLYGGAVSFESADKKNYGRALIEAGGHFRMATLAGQDGAFPGEYRVSIIAPVSFSAKPLGRGGPGGEPPLQSLADKYGSFDTSGLTVVVKPEKNKVTLKLDRAAKK